MSRDHFVRDMDCDRLRVRTYCGLDGWRNDGFSRYFKTARNGVFTTASEQADVTCARCRRALDGESL